MFRNIFLNLQYIILATMLIAFAMPVAAQRTGDHIVPAIETVCDDDPFNFGLCNAYCEALDCDSDTPLGTPQACENHLKNYLKHSDGALPPCEQSCPCAFDLEGDFADLVVFGDEEFAPPPIDVATTYDEFCDTVGPNGENTLVATALQFPDTGTNDPQGILLAYWVADETDEDPASCNELGFGFDGTSDSGLDGSYSYGPWITRQTSLSGDEQIICSERLANLCPTP
jgi:hypothetical protein